ACNAHVSQCKAWQLGDVAVVLGIEPRFDNVDDADGTLFLCASLEEFLFAGAHSTILKLLLDNSDPFKNLGFIDRGAVAPKKKLDDVRRYGILPRVLSHQILPHQVSIEGRRSKFVQLIKFQ